MEPPHIGHYREYLPRGLSQPKNGRFLVVPGNSSCGTTKSQNKNPVKDRLKKIDTVNSSGFRPSGKGGPGHPDPEIRRGAVSKQFFSFSKNKGGGGNWGPRAPPLGPPLLEPH